jgi:hypothetical protein
LRVKARVELGMRTSSTLSGGGTGPDGFTRGKAHAGTVNMDGVVDWATRGKLTVQSAASNAVPAAGA